MIQPIFRSISRVNGTGMLEFESFVYLDVQKTGSSFVRSYLRRLMSTEPIRRRRHEPVETVDSTKFYFITCRNPVAQYVSLYFYGVRGRGALFNALRRDQEVVRLYDGTSGGFAKWVGVLLDPMNASRVDVGYSGVSYLVGFQTWRFLTQAILDPATALSRCQSKEDVTRLYNERRIPKAVLHNERLRDQLAELVAGPLAPSVQDARRAQLLLKKMSDKNRTERPPDFMISAHVRCQIEEREWFFYDCLGYERLHDGYGE